MLAVDQGSVSCGLAFFEDAELIDLRNATGGSGPWAERMARIAIQIRNLAAASPDWSPDIVAVEDVVLHSGWMTRHDRTPPGAAAGVDPKLLPAADGRGGGPGPMTLKVMSETRGYLRVVFATTWPAAKWRNVHPSRVRGAVGAGRGRAAAKRQNRLALQAFGHWPGPATEDMCDAFVIGLAAMNDMQAERWAGLAR